MNIIFLFCLFSEDIVAQSTPEEYEYTEISVTFDDYHTERTPAGKETAKEHKSRVTLFLILIGLIILVLVATLITALMCLGMLAKKRAAPDEEQSKTWKIPGPPITEKEALREKSASQKSVASNASTHSLRSGLSGNRWTEDTKSQRLDDIKSNRWVVAKPEVEQPVMEPAVQRKSRPLQKYKDPQPQPKAELKQERKFKSPPKIETTPMDRFKPQPKKVVVKESQSPPKKNLKKTGSQESIASVMSVGSTRSTRAGGIPKSTFRKEDYDTSSLALPSSTNSTGSQSTISSYGAKNMFDLQNFGKNQKR